MGSGRHSSNSPGTALFAGFIQARRPRRGLPLPSPGIGASPAAQGSDGSTTGALGQPRGQAVQPPAGLDEPYTDENEARGIQRDTTRTGMASGTLDDGAQGDGGQRGDMDGTSSDPVLGQAQNEPGM